MRTRADGTTTVTSFQLPTNLLHRVRAAARRHDCSMAAAVRAALRMWLAKHGEEGQ